MGRKNAISTIKGKKTQQLNQREVKLINDHIVDGFLLFEVESKNSGSVLHYNIEGLISLSDFLRVNPMNKRLFVIILRHVALSLKRVDENHFDRSLIMWSMNSCYIDPSSWHVYLMYVPFQPYESDGSLKNFLLDFVANCTFEANENAEYVQTLVIEVNSGVSYTAKMLESYCDRISTDLVAAKSGNANPTRCPSCNMNLKDEETICPFCGKVIKPISPKPQEIPRHNFVDNVSSYPPLRAEVEEDKNNGAGNKQPSISINEDENGVVTVFRKAPNSIQSVWLEDRNHFGKIHITKFPFRIGKMEGVTDYRIFNNTVSRKHADFLREQGRYYIVDLGSTNGTYLNGRRIQPGVKEELSDGINLRFADAEFKFHID